MGNITPVRYNLTRVLARFKSQIIDTTPSITYQWFVMPPIHNKFAEIITRINEISRPVVRINRFTDRMNGDLFYVKLTKPLRAFTPGDLNETARKQPHNYTPMILLLLATRN